MCEPDWPALYQPFFSSILIIFRLSMCVFIHTNGGLSNIFWNLGLRNGVWKEKEISPPPLTLFSFTFLANMNINFNYARNN
jgi:hypothetical protein